MSKVTKDVIVAALHPDGLDRLLKKSGDHYIFENSSDKLLKKVVEGVVKYQLKGKTSYKGIRSGTIKRCQHLLEEANTQFLGKLSGSSSNKQSYKIDSTVLHNAWSHQLRMFKQNEHRPLSKKKTLSKSVHAVRVNSALNGAGSASADPEVDAFQKPFSQSDYATESSENNLDEEEAEQNDEESENENENEDEEGEEEENIDSVTVETESECEEGNNEDNMEVKAAKGDQQEYDDSYSYSYSYSSSENEVAMPDVPAIFETAARIAPMDVSCQLEGANGDDDDDDDAEYGGPKKRPAAALKKKPACAQPKAGNPAAKSTPAPKASKAGVLATKSKALPKPPAPTCNTESGAEPKAGTPAAKSNALPKPPAVKAEHCAPPKAGQPAGKSGPVPPPALSSYVGAHMRRLLQDKTFHPDQSNRKRMKLAAANWATLTGDIHYGCPKCRYLKNGCLKCNPHKAKPENNDGK